MRTPQDQGVLTYRELAVGQCFDDDNDKDQLVSARPCTAEHGFEVIARLTPTMDAWPGLEEFDKQADPMCAAQFEGRLDPDFAESTDWLIFRPLDEITFREDPDILCVVTDPAGSLTSSAVRR